MLLSTRILDERIFAILENRLVDLGERNGMNAQLWLVRRKHVKKTILTSQYTEKFWKITGLSPQTYR